MKRLKDLERENGRLNKAVAELTLDRRPIKILTVIDEHSRECLAIVLERRLQSDDVLSCLTELFIKHGPPEHIRSDNGSEFTARVVRQWLKRLGVQTLFSILHQLVCFQLHNGGKLAYHLKAVLVFVIPVVVIWGHYTGFSVFFGLPLFYFV